MPRFGNSENISYFMMEKPKSVFELEKKLDRRKVWYRTCPNYHDLEAKNCYDAATKRYRLGHIGIPLFSELKTRLVPIVHNGRMSEVILHCRGNQTIDDTKVELLINTKLQRNYKKDEALFGRLNPFYGLNHPDILQIFDKSILSLQTIPLTMMTNASHRQWSIEFIPKDVINILSNVMVEDIIAEDSRYSLPTHRIGILTGNTPESGIILWQKINSFIRHALDRDFLGDISFPEVIIESLPSMGLSMELSSRHQQVSEVIFKGITNLCNRNASIVCIACNTSQYLTESVRRICSDAGATYLDIPSETVKYLNRKHITEFDFLGINYVTDFENWSGFKDLSKRFSVNVPEIKDIEKINALAFEIKEKGPQKGTGYQKLAELIDESTRTNTVILALTELSIVFNLHRKKLLKRSTTYIDTLDILAKGISELCTNDYLSIIKASDRFKSRSSSVR